MPPLAGSSDRRVEHTRSTLAQAFRDLVLRRRYDQFNVVDIVKRAGIARSTFYGHYQSKDDLLREGLTEPFQVIAACAFEPLPPNELEHWVCHFWENRRVATALFGGRGRGIALRLLEDLIEDRLKQHAILPFPSPLVAHQVASSQIGLLSAWLSGHTPCEPARLAQMLHLSAVGAFRALLSSADPSRNS